MSDKSVDVDEDVLPFLSSSARVDLKSIAITYFVGLSGTVDGRQLVTSKNIYIDRIIELACDDVPTIVKDAVSCLINIAGDSNGVNLILQSPLCDRFLDSILSSVILKGCALADAIAMLLSNISRESKASMKIIDMLLQDDPPATFENIIQAMCVVGFNENADLHFLAPFLANLSQVSVARQHFLCKDDKRVLQKLLPFTKHESPIRRQGVSTIVKNCCFDHGYHEWLLSSEVDILPFLLLPLAGPEEFDEEEMDKLPVELQYLEPSKTREPLAIVRANLVEALTQLCTTQYGRVTLRESNAYVILREYHKWEPEPTNHPLVTALIEILIGDEPNDELGTTNLRDVVVPPGLQEQFNKAKQEEMKLAMDSCNP